VNRPGKKNAVSGGLCCDDLPGTDRQGSDEFFDQNHELKVIGEEGVQFPRTLATHLQVAGLAWDVRFASVVVGDLVRHHRTVTSPLVSMP
jgi:hypothetical protein